MSNSLSELRQNFILHWGEMGSKWGINRSMGQIHGLLLTSEEPLTAEEISECLGIARSNVSTSLRELQGWGIVKIQHQWATAAILCHRAGSGYYFVPSPANDCAKYYRRWTC